MRKMQLCGNLRKDETHFYQNERINELKFKAEAKYP